MTVEPQVRPVLATVPSVELIHVGKWKISTGEWDVTPADLAAAVAALDCPAVHRPIIKLGHTDARFDGEPAVGFVDNMGVSASGSELRGDLAGLPSWLAEVMPSAYPNRSVEGSYDHACQLGHTHPFVLTGLALLGVTPPGIGTLESLSDVAALYGVAPTTVAAAARAQEETMPSAKVAAAATVEDVRRSFYDGPAATKWWWIEELYVDPSEAIVVDDESGELYRFTYAVAADGTVTWGEPQVVKRTYVAASSALRTPVSAWASKAESRPAGPPGKAPRAATTVTAPTDPPPAPAAGDTPQKDGGSPPMPMQLSDEQAASLRAQYGLPETATLEEIVGAALTGQAPATPPATDPATPPAGTQTPATPATPVVPAGQAVPEGAVLVDAEQWRETQVAAQAGRAARERQVSEDRDRIVSAAVTEGRIPPSRRDHWRAMLDADPEGTPAVLASFQIGASVPTVPLGHSGTELSTGHEPGAEDNYGYLTGVPLLPTGGN